MLDRLLGFFEIRRSRTRSAAGLLQHRLVTHVVNDADHRLWEENRIFFLSIQGGKDRHGASFSAELRMLRRRRSRRSAASPRRPSRKTWRRRSYSTLGMEVVLLREMLAYGLAPSSSGQYHVRAAWGRVDADPAEAQSADVPRAERHAAAAVCLVDDGLLRRLPEAGLLPGAGDLFFTGWLPVRTTDYDLLVRLIPYMLLTYVSFELLSAERVGSHLRRYNMAKFTTYMAAVPALFTRKRLKFNVTPKGTGHVPFYTYGPQLVLFGLSLTSLVWGVLAFYHGWIDYPVSGWTAAAFLVNAFWVCWNLYFSAFVVRKCLLSRQRRADHRFIESFAIQVQPVTTYGARVKARVAMTQDLNPSGLSFRAVYRHEPGTKLELELPLASRAIRVRATVIRVNKRKARYGTVFEHGVRFDEMPAPRVTSSSTTARSIRCRSGERIPPVIPVFEHVAGWLNDQRATKRQLCGASRSPSRPAHRARAMVDTGIASLEDVIRKGAAIMENPLEPGTPCGRGNRGRR